MPVESRTGNAFARRVARTLTRIKSPRLQGSPATFSLIMRSAFLSAHAQREVVFSPARVFRGRDPIRNSSRSQLNRFVPNLAAEIRNGKPLSEHD